MVVLARPLARQAVSLATGGLKGRAVVLAAFIAVVDVADVANLGWALVRGAVDFFWNRDSHFVNNLFSILS